MLRFDRPALCRLRAFRAAPFGVDRAARTIQGFAVITRGEVKGHGLWIDSVALMQIVQLAAKHPGGIKSHFTHGGFFEDGLGKYLGRARNFQLSGNGVRADLHIAKVADQSPEGELGSYILDLAEEDPQAFGASIVFLEDREAMRSFQLQNGGPVFRSPDPENKRNLPHVRVAALTAVDIVDDPAANPDGLFGNSDAVLSWVLGLSNTKPTATSFGGIAPERVREFVQGFMARHGLEIESARAAPNQPPHWDFSGFLAEIRAEAREEGRAYAQEFDSILDAAFVRGETRRRLVDELFGKDLVLVKDRAEELGLAKYVKRFADVRVLRVNWGCSDSDPESCEYRSALERYLSSIEFGRQQK